MPGAAFHITSRTQGWEPWFKEFQLQDEIASCISEVVAASDALLLARTVMSNHFHIVLKQGQRPLAWTMQPICRRVALLVHRHRKQKGHVLERLYRSHLCWNADWLKNAIIYTHINPVRARLCDNPGAYAFSDYARYALRSDDGVSHIDLHDILKLFSNSGSESEDDLRRAYVRHVEWRLEKDRCRTTGLEFNVPEPLTCAGDRHFAEQFCGGPVPNRLVLRDLRDRARELVHRIDSDVELEALRRRWLPRPLVETRRQLIAALLQGGYQGCRIATFLRVSDTTVSAVASKIRYVSVR